MTHLIAEHFLDLSDLLRSVADRGTELRLRSGRGDEAKAGTRGLLRNGAKGILERPDAANAEYEQDAVIKVASRNFR
ncbi:hypothetical protein [Microvirga sp. ACRRW]|uniref:hypothetical protein n=1 Tax=Microvirga sp. ACRRW TaxID=2918205 RepID=UPI00351D42E3